MTLSSASKARLLVLLALGLAASSGCGIFGNTDGGICVIDTETKDTCIDLPETMDNVAASAACTAFFNSFREGHASATGGLTAGTDNVCSTSGRLGSCATTSGTVRYYSGGWTAETAQADCQGSRTGTWTAG